MSDLYLEELVERKRTGKDKALCIGMTALTLICLVGFVITFNFLLLVPFTVLCIADYFIFPKTYIEWEYQYVSGELDVDRIIKKMKRKRMASYEIVNAEIIAPVNSHRMDSYNKNTRIKTVDYTSCDPERNSKVYAMILPVDGEMTKVLFEPSEEMTRDMRTKAPRKVFFD